MLLLTMSSTSFEVMVAPFVVLFMTMFFTEVMKTQIVRDLKAKTLIPFFAVVLAYPPDFE